MKGTEGQLPEGAEGGVGPVYHLTRFQESLTEETGSLDMTQLRNMLVGLVEAVDARRQTRNGLERKEEKQTGKVKYEVRKRVQSSSSSSSSGSDDVFSDSVEEREINKREKIGKKKRYRKTRKYTVDESEATSSDSEEDRAKSNGRTWVKRLIELEDVGMDTIKATCRILVTLAGEMLEVFKSNGRANIKTV